MAEPGLYQRCHRIDCNYYTCFMQRNSISISFLYDQLFSEYRRVGGRTGLRRAPWVASAAPCEALLMRYLTQYDRPRVLITKLVLWPVKFDWMFLKPTVALSS